MLIAKSYWFIKRESLWFKNFVKKRNYLTGDDPNFSYELDLEDSSVLIQYISDEVKDALEDDEWLIKFDYNQIKSMFDPVIERIFVWYMHNSIILVKNVL